MSQGVLSPVLLVALGDLAANLSREVLRQLDPPGGSPRLPLGGLWLSSAGLETPSSEGRVDAIEPIGSLRPGVAPGVWTHNMGVLAGVERTLDSALQTAIERLRAVGVQAARRNDGLHLVILTSMTDPIGSAATLPILRTLQRVLRTSLVNLNVRAHLISLSHDIERRGFDEEESHEVQDLRSRRATAFLQELEFSFESERLPLDFVWLLDTRSETDLFVGTPSDVLPSIERMIESLIRGGDRPLFSALPARAQEVGGRQARYSAFGAAHLRFPGEEYLRIASGAVLADVLDEAPMLTHRIFDAPAIFSEASRLLTDLSLDRLPSLLSLTDASGASLRLPALPKENPDENQYDPLPFLQRLAAWDEDVRRTYLPEIPERLNARQIALRESVRHRIWAQLAAGLESEEPGGLAWAEAWLAALLGKGSVWTERSEEARGRDIIQLIEQPEQEFFDPLLVPILFPEKRNGEDAAENARTFASNVRKELIDVEQQFRDLEASDSESRERIQAIVRGDVIVELPDTTESLIARLEDRILRNEDLREEVETKQIRLLGIVEALDEGRKSATKRRDIRDRNLEAHREGCSAIESSLQKEWKNLTSLLGERGDLQRYLWIWIGSRLGGAMLGGGIFALLWLRYPAVQAAVGLLSGRLWIAIGITALALLFLDFRKRYLTPLRALADEIRGVRLTLHNLRGILIQHYNTEFGIHEEHARFGVVVDFRQWLTREIELLRSAIDQTRKALVRRREEARSEGERLSAANPVEPRSAFDLVIQTNPSLPEFLNAKQASLVTSIRKFWRDFPLVDWLTRIVELRRAPIREAETEETSVEVELTSRIDALAGEIRAVLSSDLKLSVERAFERAYPTQERRREFAHQFWIAAAPHASFARMSGFPSVATNHAVVGAVSDGSVFEALRDLGIHVEEAPTSPEDEVHLVRLSVGYPAFAFAPSFRMLPAVEEVLLNPGTASRLRPLAPRASDSGDPETYQLLVFAIASGTVEVSEDGSIEFDGRRFNSADDVLEDWTTSGGESRRARLKATLGALQEKGVRPSFRDRLAEGLAIGRVRALEDRELVEEHIALLDSEPT